MAAASGALAAAASGKVRSQARVRRIGVLSLLRLPTEFDEAFVRGLRELGYVPGADLVVEYRSAAGDAARLPGLAAELAARKVEVVLGNDRASILAVTGVDPAMPIVVAVGGDLVGGGLAASLARPGGNVTGISVLVPELSRKRLEVFADAIPGLKRIGILFNDARPDVLALQVRDAEAAADALRLAVVALGVSLPGGIEAGFADAARRGLQGVFVLSDAYTITYRDRLGAAALKHRLPTIFSNRTYLTGGGFMSYGPDIEDAFRRAARYVDRILKGAKPAEMAIEQPTKIELAFNLRTAKALGVAIPTSLLVRADEVIR